MQETRLTIDGPLGQLEAIYLQPEHAIGEVAVICHPHSLHGGSMQNKVVTTLARTYRDAGIASVRFNFRGVGQSAGEFDNGIGEVNDLLAVITWLQRQRPDAALHLAGFSFGSYVSYRAASCHHLPLRLLISVAPPTPHFDFASLARPDCPWLVIQGADDELFSGQAVVDFMLSLAKPPEVEFFAETGQFFHGI